MTGRTIIRLKDVARSPICINDRDAIVDRHHGTLTLSLEVAMTAHTYDRAIAAPSATSSAGVFGAVSALLARLSVWREVSRQRRALARLTPAQLRDIGLDREAAMAEASRLFWDAPRHWRV
jgi:uncharacterized protein YjiS (DUF1127 family)